MGLMSSDPGNEDGGGGVGATVCSNLGSLETYPYRHIHARNLRLTFAQCGSIASTENHMTLYCGQNVL